MAETGSKAVRPTDPVGRLLYRIARALAVVGGVILSAVALMTAVSIVGRAAFSEPVRGDFEIVAIGTGIAVFAFLPWCQLTRGNVIVDFFMDRAPVRAKALCDALGGMLYVALGALLTWRMVFGGIDMHRYAELSLTPQLPALDHVSDLGGPDGLPDRGHGLHRPSQLPRDARGPLPRRRRRRVRR